MHIIPAINCQEFDEVQERFKVAQEILFGISASALAMQPWVHLDIADGSFTNGYETWRNSADFAKMKRNRDLKIEVHIMATQPEAIIAEWLSAGIHRVIFHLETADNVEAIASMCREGGVEAMLALTQQTSVEHAIPYLSFVTGCQVLAVTPGLSGQLMHPTTLNKITELRRAKPELLIEVDGGITLQTARQCQEAGANQLTSSSFLFTAENPATAYAQLTGLAEII